MASNFNWQEEKIDIARKRTPLKRTPLKRTPIKHKTRAGRKRQLQFLDELPFFNEEDVDQMGSGIRHLLDRNWLRY